MKRTAILALLLLGVVVMAIFSSDNTSNVATAHEEEDHHHEVHPHAKALKNDDGSWKYTNKLVNETSPYLLQHAHNPVDWYPWGKEAFEKARKEGKVIFLSIGYSTCYWCHVMERLVFENPEIARQMNEQFVCIKVDREERPDVDDIYMAATQIVSRGGGWPMSVWLTPPGANGEKDPGLRPIIAGTYFPPQAQHGRPGFPDVCDAVHGAWKNERQKVLAQADQIAAAVTEYLGELSEPGEVHPLFIERTADTMLRSYDPTHGGFGKAPKFPTPNTLTMLMAAHQARPNDELWDAIAYTLERMARGGMYDQVGGGFHRYSVDDKWLVPHFEKMLYDNGQLVEAYLLAQSIEPDENDPQLYTRVVREICDYVLREMTDETGTFWSAQDAEVDAKEGDNYVWTPEQIRKALDDAALADLAVRMLGLDKGPNFRDPHHPHAQPVNVLYLPQRLDELANAEGMTMQDLLAKRDAIRKQLLAVRDKRKQPGTDDKVLTSWNGLMIAGMARAGSDLKEDRYLAAAAKAADYILSNMRTDDGGLYRSMRGGKARIPAFLEDYAFFVHGLIALHRADGDTKWLDAAAKLTDVATQKFAIRGDNTAGYYDTLADQADLFVRTRTTYDGATPSGNSVMVNNLVSLHALTKKPAYLDQAIKDLQSFSAPLRRQGTGMTHMLHAALRAMQAAPDRFPKGGLDLAGPAAPTAENPVVARLGAKEVALKDGAGEVKVTLTIHKDFHTNSNNPGDPNLVPTTLKLEGVQGMRFDVKYPAGEKKKFAYADTELAVYEGAVVLEATLTKTGPVTITGKPRIIVSYQACTNENCLLPAEIELPLVLSIE